MTVAGPPVEAPRTTTGKRISEFSAAGGTRRLKLRGQSRGIRCWRLNGIGEARGGTHDANFGGHADFAQELFFHALHVEIDAAAGLGYEVDGAEFESFQRAGSAFLAFRADDDDGPRIVGHYVGGGLEAVHVRHVQVHGDDVGLERFRESDGFAAIAGAANDLKLAVSVENGFEDFAHEGRVVHDEHAEFFWGSAHHDVSQPAREDVPPPFR